MDYLHKIEKNPYKDLYWNIPDEQKQGSVVVVGGNGANFITPIRTAEFLEKTFPLKEVRLALPDVLRNKLPNLPNLKFLASTDSGSFADGKEIKSAVDEADFGLLIGDFSKNSITAVQLQSACLSSDKPLLLTRDAIDLITDESLERILMRENIILMGSLVQLQKVFKMVYYPKMIMLSQSLLQITEAIHKFTLSYPVSIITLHDGQVIVAKNGIINVIPIDKVGVTPMALWSGEVAGKIVAMNIFSPNSFLEATTAGLFFTN
jgi:hypothetical protein